MDWILAHLKLVFIVASAIAYWINQRRSEAPQTRTRPAPRTSEQASPKVDDERVRRVQEEIQRKIIERLRGGPAAGTPPIQAQPSNLRRLQPPSRKPIEPARAAPANPQRVEVIPPRQKKIAEGVRILEAKRAQIVREAGNVVESGRLRSEAGWKAAETRLMADLRDPASLRRAVIMREVLGSPVGLR